MLEKIYLIGIGPGDPKYLTLEAKELIERLSLFLIPKKVGSKKDLTLARLSILEKIKGKKNYEIIFLPFPEREKGVNYKEKVREWRQKKAEILKEALLAAKAKEAGFLIWGDPTIYDGHIEIFQEIEKDLPIKWEVIPGLSAFQVLASKCKCSLTELSTPLSFHTPRTLRLLKEITHPIVVFLDNYETYKKFKEHPLELIWGAFVGSNDEIIMRGKLKEIAESHSLMRKNLKNKKGYLMEIYILKPLKS